MSKKALSPKSPSSMKIHQLDSGVAKAEIVLAVFEKITIIFHD